MLKYARSDTHFLLYIYDNLRNALLDRSQTASQSQSSIYLSASSPLEQGLLGQALARSAETSLRVYAKEPYDALGGSGQCGWDKLARKWNKVALTAAAPGVGIGAMQREVYSRVHEWRDKVAREEDESTKYAISSSPLGWPIGSYVIKIRVAEPCVVPYRRRATCRNGFFAGDVPDFGVCCGKKEGEGAFKCD